ncbi:GNAT family N-acetyltransferase [Paraclostridium bifermentans]|uniref:GNAT family N-acetyltransferase n=1 Tax=Paraclostridium bifermentans TaxID=1490 RepID=UPI00214A3402|nr:GNAT family N-acetyltransferase [Paraclostridium bifermentans]MCR1877189.1 GNAT family N-acetyltransferase [Paraclostridium bifermentans]
MSIKLLKLDRRYVNDVGDLLADSFIDNPLMLYFFPDEYIRKKILPKLYRSIADITMTMGTVYATSKNLEGVIGVVDNRKRVFSLNMLRAIVKSLFINLPSLKYISLIDIIKKSKNISMNNYPNNIDTCLYIEMVAVDKRYRGQKHMSKLIRSVLNEAKNNNLHCILQTETEENVMRYEHLGFKLYNKIESVPEELYHYVLIYSPYDDI